MARTARGVRGFAAELAQAGCRVKWLDEYTFEVDNRRTMGRRRSAEVHFYRDVDQFFFAYASHQTLRSMAAVRRYLKVAAP